MRSLTSPQPHIVREQHPGEDGVNKKKNKDDTVAAPHPRPRHDQRHPQFDKNGTHPAGPTATQIEGGMTVRRRRKIPQDANNAQNTEETA